MPTPALLEVTTGFGSGSAIAALDLITCSTVEQLDNNNSLTARVRLPFRTTVRLRTPLRLTGIDGLVREYRVRQITRDPRGAWADLDAGSPLLDLATAGPVSTTVGGVQSFAITATLTLSQWLTTYVLTNLTADGLTWLDTTPGTIDSTATISRTYTKATRLEMLNDLASAAGLELALIQNGVGGLYRVHFLTQRGATATPLFVSAARNALAQQEATSDDNVITHVAPFGAVPQGGTSPATLADNLWSVAGFAGDGWMLLSDLAGGGGPVAFDDMLNGLAVVGPLTGAAAPTVASILDSRASDHAIQLASYAGFTTGTLVRIAADTSGTALTALSRPTAVAAYGRAVKPLDVANGRGEANRLRNGRFQTAGLVGVTAVNPTTPPAFIEVRRPELGVTITGAANGARAAATGTGTPLALKNLPANAWVRQQDTIQVGGLTYTISADTIASTTGTLALPITPTLSGTFADNTAITLERRATLSLTLTTAVSPLDAYLFFDANAANDYLTFSSSLANTSLSTATYATSAGLTAFTYLGTDNYMGALRVQTRTAVGATGLDTIPFNWATKSSDVFAVTPTSFTFTDADNGTLNYSGAAGTIQVGLRVRLFNGSAFAIGRVTAFTGTTMTLAREGYIPFQSVASSTLIAQGVYASMAMISAGTVFTANVLRESRTLNLNGVHNAGTATLNTKAVTNISTRNWVNGDTIRFEAALSATAVITASLYQGQDIDTPALTFYRLTYNSTTSTNLELWNPATDGNITVSFPAGAGYCTAYDIDKVNKYLFVSYMNDDPAQGVAVATGAATGIMKNTYTVNAGASWAATGLVTLTTSAGISTTRYAITRGMRVFSNFYANTPQLYVETASVTNGATSIQLRGEANADTVQPGYPVTGVLYRVLATASKIPFPGNTLYAASSVQANASGVVNVTVTAANPNAIVDNDAVTITRPSLLRAGTDPTTGSVIRLLSAPGNNSIPLISTPGAEFDPVYVEVPSGGTRTVTAFVTVVMNAGTYTLGQLPCIALVGGGAVLSYARVADSTVTVNNLAYVRLITSTTVSASQAVALRVYGGFSGQPANWHVALDAMVCVTASTDVPYVDGSWANVLWRAATNALRVNGREYKSLTLTVAQLQYTPGAMLAPVAPVLGGVVTSEDTGDTVRVVGVRTDHVDYTKSQLTLDTLQPLVSRLLASER